MEVLATIDWAAFHFLRPEWLWALLLLLPLSLWVWAGSHAAGAWKAIVDPALQPFMLTQGQAERRWYKRLWLLLVWLLAVIALAGPSWEQRPTPLLRSEQARIVVLDLSRSMLATDMRPSRLDLARLKVQDMLQQSRDSKAGLVAFAAQAFPIAPLTDDIQTLLAQVPTLHPDLMPAQGGRIDRALLQAMDMLKHGGAGGGGQVLLVTDSSPQEAAFAAAQKLRDAGYELSVLAVGTEEGAPIEEDTRRGRGFVKDRNGNIVVARLPTSELRQLALSGGGQFSLITPDDSDIAKLTKVLERDRDNKGEDDAAKAGDQWIEAGPYLLLLLSPFAALGFRRGWLMSAVLAVGVMQPPELQAEQAADQAAELGSSLWFNADQRGKQALEQGDAEKAAELFESKDWKANAQYRAGGYQEAADYWGQKQQAEAFYNQGNALAHAGDIQAAMKAWQQVPESDAFYDSAQHNIEVMKKLQDQQQQNQQQDQQQDQQQENDDSDSEQSQENQNSQNEPEQSQQQDSEQQQQSSSEQQNQQQESEQSEAEQQQAEQEQSEEAEQEQAAQEQAEQNEEAGGEERQAQLQKTAEEQAKDQVIDQWLKRIPDDPGGLLREKFKRDYQRRIQQRGSEYQDEEQAW